MIVAQPGSLALTALRVTAGGSDWPKLPLAASYLAAYSRSVILRAGRTVEQVERSNGGSYRQRAAERV